MEGEGSYRYAHRSEPFYRSAFPDKARLAVPGNYDGLGSWEPANYLGDGRWETGGRRGVIDFPVPTTGRLDLVAADYDGDGRTEPAYFDTETATWYVEGRSPLQFGYGTDVVPPPCPEIEGCSFQDMPIPADYDGDGDDDIAVYRPTDGTFHVRGHGQIADLPIGFPAAADFDGDGDDDPTVYRDDPSEDDGGGIWYLVDRPPYPYGTGYLPAPADFDGDGDDDLHTAILLGFGEEVDASLTPWLATNVYRLAIFIPCEPPILDGNLCPFP